MVCLFTDRIHKTRLALPSPRDRQPKRAAGVAPIRFGPGFDQYCTVWPSMEPLPSKHVHSPSEPLACPLPFERSYAQVAWPHGAPRDVKLQETAPGRQLPTWSELHGKEWKRSAPKKQPKGPMSRPALRDEYRLLRLPCFYSTLCRMIAPQRQSSRKKFARVSIVLRQGNISESALDGYEPLYCWTRRVNREALIQRLWFWGAEGRAR